MRFTLSGTISQSAPTQSTRVPGATVQVIQASGTESKAVADADGAFAVVVAPGSVRVRVSAPDYEVTERALTVSADTTLSLELVPAKREWTGVYRRKATAENGPFPQAVYSTPMYWPGSVIVRVLESCIDGCLASSYMNVCLEVRDSRNARIGMSVGGYDSGPRHLSFQGVAGEIYTAKLYPCFSGPRELFMRVEIEVKRRPQ